MVEQQLPRLGQLVLFQVKLVMVGDFNAKMRERGVERLMVLVVCKVARDETQVRETLDALWKDPDRAGENMAEFRVENADLYKFEEMLENGGVRESNGINQNVDV